MRLSNAIGRGRHYRDRRLSRVCSGHCDVFTVFDKTGLHRSLVRQARTTRENRGYRDSTRAWIFTATVAPLPDISSIPRHVHIYTYSDSIASPGHTVQTMQSTVVNQATILCVLLQITTTSVSSSSDYIDKRVASPLRKIKSLMLKNSGFCT
jgi:hypothetical protein